MTRPTIHSLIVDDLGYCCEFFFFSRYKQTAVIAARLGVTTRAVKYHKAAVRDGCEKCPGAANCMKAILKKPRNLP